MSIGLRPYLPSDAETLAAIFIASIEQVACEDYDVEQIAAWTSKAEDEAAFGARLGAQLTLVATVDGEVAGFASLRGADVLDMLYVHPEALGRALQRRLSMRWRNSPWRVGRRRSKLMRVIRLSRFSPPAAIAHNNETPMRSQASGSPTRQC